MARDYKRTTAYKPKTKIPGWLNFIFGLAVGLFAAFLFFIKDYDERSVSSPAAVVQIPATPQAETKDSGAPPPRYDFYTILPEQEVIIPDQDSKETKETKAEKPKQEGTKPPPPSTTPATTTTSATATTTPPATPVGKLGAYVLQVGSFKKMEEADRLRASLALIGIESSVQVVRIGDNDNWHRVRIGPFEDLNRINKIRSKLKQNNYNSILLQVKA